MYAHIVLTLWIQKQWIFRPAPFIHSHIAHPLAVDIPVIPLLLNTLVSCYYHFQDNILLKNWLHLCQVHGRGVTKQAV